MQSLQQINIIFLFYRYSWLTKWLKTSNLSLEGRGLSFFPLSAEKKTQNRLMTGHSYEMFVHSKQSKAKRELLPRLTFQKYFKQISTSECVTIVDHVFVIVSLF